VIALWGTVVAALIAAILAPWAKARIDARKEDRDETKQAKVSLEKVTEQRVERLFNEYDQLRKTYRSDLDDARAQIREANSRIALLEHEVAEWRAGVRGVEGVWVAVPSHIWDFVRERLPELPPHRLPGERPPGENP
jgi:hypothetical protein